MNAESSALIADFERLLDDVAGLRAPTSTPVTFLEAAGYPHYENVASNLMCYFLNPTESHGLGTLFLEALLEPLELESMSFISVEREAVTNNGNRLDLVIELESHVIGVENKIYAGLYNPFDDYRSYLERVSAGRAPVLIVLSVYEQVSLPPGLVLVTYNELMARVRAELGVHASEAPAQSLVFALDFVKTMENFRKGSQMDRAVLDLMVERRDDVLKFLKVTDESVRELRRKVQIAAGAASELVPSDLPPGVQVHQWLWREKSSLTDDVVHDVEFPSGTTIAVDSYLQPGGWEIVVWQRHVVTGRPLTTPELLEWLLSQDAPLLVELEEAGRRHDSVLIGHFPYEALEHEVMAHAVKVVEAIARAGTAPGEGQKPV